MVMKAALCVPPALLRLNGALRSRLPHNSWSFALAYNTHVIQNVKSAEFSFDLD